MKPLKRLLSMMLSATLILSLGTTAFAARKDDDDEEDYSVSDVYFDVSDSAVYVGWTVGDSECKYSVQLYDSKDMKAKNKVGSASTVSYNAEQVDVTQKILNHGSGTYYAVVTAKSKPKNGTYASAWARETISSEDLSTIRKNAKSSGSDSGSGSGSTSSGGTSSGNTAGPGSAAPVQSAQWVALTEGRWAYVYSNGIRATGWFEDQGKWYFSGEDGIMYANQWLESAAVPGVWYYLGASGAMAVNEVLTIDVDGVPLQYSFDENGVATRIS